MNPTIRFSKFDHSIKELVVEVEPYRTNDRAGDEVQVLGFYNNGGMITAEGAKIRKDGQPANRRQVIFVEIPENVRQALGR